jgi:ribosome maturation factor RimP
MSLDAKIRKIIEDPLQHLGFELVQVRFVEGGKPKLEILIERLDMTPVTVEDCTKANRTISTHLDVEDPIRSAYILEVSSAGIDRPLIEHKDYVRFTGYKVFIQTIVPIFGTKKFRGFLEKVTLNHIYIRSDVPNLDELVEIAFADILKGKLDLDYMIELKMKERKEQNET